MGGIEAMTVTQLKTTGELAFGIFAMAFVGAVVTTVQAGTIPQTWPQIQHVLAGAAMAGAMAVFGWLKMKSPVSPEAQTQKAVDAEEEEDSLPSGPPKL
jgi:hypothetical protein